MPLKSGGAVDNEKMRGRTNSGLISIGKTSVAKLYTGLIGRATGTDYVDVVKTDPETSSMTNITVSGQSHFFVGKHGSFLYITGVVSDADNTGIVSKVNADTLSEVATLTFSAGEELPQSGIIVGDYLYVGLRISPARIVKIDLTTFTEVATLTLDAGDDWVLEQESMVASSGFLYVACYLTTPGRIVKVDLSTFTKTATLTLSAGEDNPTNLAVSEGMLYVGLDLSPGRVTKINLSTFTKVSTLTLSAGENEAWLLVVSGNNLYVICYVTPNKVVKIDLSTFAKVSTLTFTGADEEYAGGDAIIGSTLYVQCIPSAATQPIVKVDLGTFTETGRINLDAQNAGNVARCLFAL